MSCIAEAVGQPFEAFTYAEQVHGNEVTIVSLQEQGHGAEHPEKQPFKRRMDLLQMRKESFFVRNLQIVYRYFSMILLSVWSGLLMQVGKARC